MSKIPCDNVSKTKFMKCFRKVFLLTTFMFYVKIIMTVYHDLNAFFIDFKKGEIS